MHARIVGRKVSPVLADPSIRRGDLPPWIRRADVYDIAEPERWTMLVQVLRGPGETRRVPYMTGILPDPFVERRAEYQGLKKAVLSAHGGKAVAVTTALRGSGGYGKTTLANQLCLDPEVRFEFTDGILRVEIGKERGDVMGLVLDLIERLDPRERRPGFQDVYTASDYLGELIGEARLLMVIDDVWREAQLRPFLKGGPNCIRLITTRLQRVLPRSAQPIPIDRMVAEDAVRLLSANLPMAGDPAVQRRLTALARRLGCWAQMLSIANGWIAGRIRRKEKLGDAVDRFEARLEQHGLTTFDPQDETERNRAIRACLEASLEDLSTDELVRLGELAILPEDEAISFEVIEALWAETGSLDEDQVDGLLGRLDALSLIQSLDLGARTLRLHDNMIWYLSDRIGPAGRRAAHQAMVQTFHRACEGNWATLPEKPARHAYGWQYLIRHLRGAGQDEEADRVLTDYGWIKAKLHTLAPPEVWKLFASYLPESENEGVRLAGRAIALSLPVLAANPRELPRQLFGRLGGSEHKAAASIVARAKADGDFRPAPRWPGLTPPGAERLRLVHEGLVDAAVFSPDGTRVLTVGDKTARLWDAQSGAEISVLRGHERHVTRGCFSTDGWQPRCHRL